MAKIDLSTITEALSEEQPCGPDLDMEFDMDFMTFAAEIDGEIPTRYFGWDPSTLDFNKYYDQIGDFLQKTRDIRLLVPLAKLRILQSDLPGFAEALDAIHRLLRERWSEVHPQPAEFLDLSMGQLATLDDMPNVVLPLQHATLGRSRRAGAITLRKWQLAHGEVNAREGEDAVDLDTISGALAEVGAEELGGMRDALVRARDALAGIRTVCMQEAGYDKAPPIERLPQALDAAIAMIETVTGGDEAADSGAAEQGEAEGMPGAPAEAGSGTVAIRLPAGAIATREAAVEAMHVAERYFALHEPSSPVPILLREAQSASGKTFYELVNELLPENAAAAAIALGKDIWFDVQLSTLDARNPAPDYGVEESGTAAAEDAGLGDDEIGGGVAEITEDGAPEGDGPAPVEPESGQDPAQAHSDATDGPETEAAPAPAADQTPAAEAVVQPEVEPHPAAAAPKFVAGSRPEAVALLEKVLAYYRVAEPTSPVPLFVERAIELSSKSFIELLGKVLPEGSLKAR